MMRIACKANKDPTSQIEQLIALMEKMFKYTDRISPLEALANPLFSNNIRFNITVADPSIHAHTLFIYKKVNLCAYTKLAEIDLSLSQASRRCLHLPYLKEGYNIIIEKQGTQNIEFNQRVCIEQNSDLILMKSRENLWSIKKLKNQGGVP